MHSSANATFLVHRLVRREFEVLIDRANLAAEVRDLPVAQLREVLARDDDLAARGAQLAREEHEQGRLARAGVTHDEHELAGIDVKADVVERGLVGLGRVDECYVSERDGRLARVGYHAVKPSSCRGAKTLWSRACTRCRPAVWDTTRPSPCGGRGASSGVCAVTRGDRLQGLGVRRRLGRRVRPASERPAPRAPPCCGRFLPPPARWRLHGTAGRTTRRPGPASACGTCGTRGVKACRPPAARCCEKWLWPLELFFTKRYRQNLASQPGNADAEYGKRRRGT